MHFYYYYTHIKRLSTEGRDGIVRCRIYKAITRAHLTFYLINETVKGGWFEWLQHVRFLKKEKDQFEFDKAKKAYKKNVVEGKRRKVRGKGRECILTTNDW